MSRIADHDVVEQTDCRSDKRLPNEILTPGCPEMTRPKGSKRFPQESFSRQSKRKGV